MRKANVLSTIETLNICATGKPKAYAFVSSTSAMEIDTFLGTSCKISESDDLSSAKSGLQIGYGQSKWVSEYLVREAGSRGLAGTIVRPGYVLGDITTGVSNTDDFLIRLIKGCTQIGSMPNIQNNINMASVNFVARLINAATLNPPRNNVRVAQVTGNPRMSFYDFLSILPAYGFDVRPVNYDNWKTDLENHISKHSSENALFSLLHYVSNDLPANSQTPELDDSTAMAILEADSAWIRKGQDIHKNITESDIALYIAYLVGIKFLPAPTLPSSRSLPTIKISDDFLRTLSKVGGRGGNV